MSTTSLRANDSNWSSGLVLRGEAQETEGSPCVESTAVEESRGRRAEVKNLNSSLYRIAEEEKSTTRRWRGLEPVTTKLVRWSETNSKRHNGLEQHGFIIPRVITHSGQEERSCNPLWRKLSVIWEG
ncbi:hypothetical protein Bca4012_010144 [Brassica carinata]|uniref:Uncharacterized protein n=1 Tax=Brassica carinata TaxID=52824 RepID=A0A8X7S731_BRACI|nr:hypothetical protein Bca52824_035146 [Brassica carinata]